MWRLIVSSLVLLSGCAWWQAGINDPEIVADSISRAEPYREVANAIYPHAGTAVVAALIPLLILLGGKKKKGSDK